MGTELVVNLPNIKQGHSTSGNQTVGSMALLDYFASSDSVQHSRRCVEILDTMPLPATGEGANFTLKEVDELIVIDYRSDV